MPDQARPPRSAVSPSSGGTSAGLPEPEKEQLSSHSRVQSSVSTAAMDRGVLMASLGPRPAGDLQPAMAGAESYTDAEVFLRVYRSRQTYEASAKFTTWLYRIATNLAVNHARDTRKERPEVTVSLDE